MIYFVKPRRPDALGERIERNNDGVLCPVSKKEKFRVLKVLILKPDKPYNCRRLAILSYFLCIDPLVEFFYFLQMTVFFCVLYISINIKHRYVGLIGRNV